MDDASLINGLVAKRAELVAVNADLRERMAVVSNDIEAVERVLQSLGYVGEGVTTPRAARIVLFYRNELREYLLAELRKAPSPMTARELAVKLCEVEGRDWQDRRLITDVVRRVEAYCERCGRRGWLRGNAPKLDRFGKCVSDGVAATVSMSSFVTALLLSSCFGVIIALALRRGHATDRPHSGTTIVTYYAPPDSGSSAHNGACDTHGGGYSGGDGGAACQ